MMHQRHPGQVDRIKIQERLRSLSGKYQRAIQEKFALQIVVNTYEGLLNRLDDLSHTIESQSFYLTSPDSSYDVYQDAESQEENYQSIMSPVNTSFIQSCMELHRISLNDYEKYIDNLLEEMNKLSDLIS